MNLPEASKQMRHPRGLAVLFFTEMWERFSYYGMRGILLLFMVNAANSGGLGLDAKTAAAIYGLYTALVYLLALPGGWVADRLTGQQKAVFIGGSIIAAGHFTMAIPLKETFYGGLFLIVIGTGLLKPNISAIVGDLYPEGGARRDAGFSIFYMGINLGAFIGPLVCGYLGENVNWHLGFSAAGFGMAAGLVQYKLGGKYLGEAGTFKTKSPEGLAKDRATFYKALGGAGLMAVLAGALQQSGFIHITLQGAAQATGVIIVSLAVVYFAYIIFLGKLGTREKKRVAVIFLLFVGAALFWSGFEQAGSSFNLFAERLTERMIGGWEMPASWLQSVPALFIIVFAPFFAWLWVWLAHREPSIPTKFGLGLLFLGGGFLVLAWGATYSSESGPGVSPMWLITTYLLHTFGELSLSPVGLSSVTKLSPKRLVGQMMGVWFMGSALGNLMAGLLAGNFETLPLWELFGYVFMISAGAGLLFLIFSKPIQKLTGNLGSEPEE
jgi:POT family proton-dependent oligopeptide transporter